MTVLNENQVISLIKNADSLGTELKVLQQANIELGNRKFQGELTGYSNQFKGFYADPIKQETREFDLRLHLSKKIEFDAIGAFDVHGLLSVEVKDLQYVIGHAIKRREDQAFHCGLITTQGSPDIGNKIKAFISENKIRAERIPFANHLIKLKERLNGPYGVFSEEVYSTVSCDILKDEKGIPSHLKGDQVIFSGLQQTVHSLTDATISWLKGSTNWSLLIPLPILCLPNAELWQAKYSEGGDLEKVVQVSRLDYHFPFSWKEEVWPGHTVTVTDISHVAVVDMKGFVAICRDWFKGGQLADPTWFSHLRKPRS